MGSEHNTLNFAEAYQYFDPLENKVLTPGYVSPEYNVEGKAIAEARGKLQNERSKWSWEVVETVGDDWVRTAHSAVDRANGVSSASEASGSSPERSTVATRATDLKARPKKPLRFAAWPDGALRALAKDGQIARKPLAFYPGGELWHVEPYFEGGRKIPPRRLLMAKVGGEPRAVLLRGRNHEIYEFNKVGGDPENAGLTLSDCTAEEYLAFFCEHIFGDAGPFLIIERDHRQAEELPDRLMAAARDTREGRALEKKLSEFRTDKGLHLDKTRIESFPRAELAWPITALPRSEAHRWRFLTTVVYGGAVFRAAFGFDDKADASGRRGIVSMLADAPIDGAAVTPIRFDWRPDLDEPELGARK